MAEPEEPELLASWGVQGVIIGVLKTVVLVEESRGFDSFFFLSGGVFIICQGNPSICPKRTPMRRMLFQACSSTFLGLGESQRVCCGGGVGGSDVGVCGQNRVSGGERKGGEGTEELPEGRRSDSSVLLACIPTVGHEQTQTKSNRNIRRRWGLLITDGEQTWSTSWQDLGALTPLLWNWARGGRLKSCKFEQILSIPLTWHLTGVSPEGN